MFLRTVKNKSKLKSINIAFLGNVNNNYYDMSQILKGKKDLKLTLYINKKDPIINLPTYKINDQEINIKYLNSRRNILIRIAPYLSTLRFQLKKHDIIFLSAEFITLAPFCKSFTVFFPTGADLTQAPFPKMYDEYFSFNWIIKTFIRMHSFYVRKGIEREI